ncbi:MAG: type IV pilus modification protein PilV [Betaproteobacteria bacterium]
MSMIEVLVAILILVVGIFGVAAMQATALRSSQSAMESSQAVVQAYAIMDRMRADRADARIGFFDLGHFGSDLGGSGTTDWTCALPADGGGMAVHERFEWMTNVQADLGPASCVVINCNDLNCDVGVRWDDSRATGGSNARIFATRSRL